MWYYKDYPLTCLFLAISLAFPESLSSCDTGCKLLPTTSKEVVRSNSYNLSNSTFKTKQHNYRLCVESKNNDANERIYTAETDWLEKFMVLPGVGIVRESGMDMDTLLYLTRTTDKDLLGSTGNSTQYSYGKRILKRIETCLCTTESVCSTPETNTTLYINYTSI